MISDVARITVKISSGGTTSDTADLGGYALAGIQLPSAFTGTAVSFQASYDGATWGTVTIDGAADSYLVSPSAYVPVFMDDYRMRYLRVVSNAAEAGERDIVLHLAR